MIRKRYFVFCIKASNLKTNNLSILRVAISYKAKKGKIIIARPKQRNKLPIKINSFFETFHIKLCGSISSWLHDWFIKIKWSNSKIQPNIWSTPTAHHGKPNEMKHACGVYACKNSMLKNINQEIIGKIKATPIIP